MSVPSTSLALSHSLSNSSLLNLPAAPPQDALDAAISQSQARLAAAHHEAMKLERKCIFYIGKRCHGLEEEESSLRKELAAKQHNAEFLPKLYQEQWSAHLVATHESLKVLSEVINDFIKSFKQFQASFPQEAISKFQENTIPNNGWLKELTAFVNEHQASSITSSLPPKAEAVQQIVRVHVEDSMLVEAASMQGVVPYLQELRGLEDRVVQMKRDVLVFEEREQSLRTHNAQTIESWNKVVVPYLNKAHSFQEMVVKFLQQQNTLLSQLNEEQVSCQCGLVSNRFPGGLANYPEAIRLLTRIRDIPGERITTTKKRDQASPLQKTIDLIVSLIEKMVFKKSIEECKR